MKRRQFISGATLMGAGIFVNPLTHFAGLLPKEKFQHNPVEGLINVACVISARTTNIDWVGPEAVFQTWHFNRETKKHEKKFNVYTISETTDPVSGIVPAFSFSTAPAPQVIVVPAQQGSAAMHNWLAAVQTKVDVMMTVCVGARHLALAGLLDGKTATTHFESIDDYSKEFPKVKWVKGVRFAQDGNIYTSGGLTAGIDLALHIVEKYFGRERAQFVADHLEYKGIGW